MICFLESNSVPIVCLFFGMVFSAVVSSSKTKPFPVYLLNRTVTHAVLMVQPDVILPESEIPLDENNLLQPLLASLPERRGASPVAVVQKIADDLQSSKR